MSVYLFDLDGTLCDVPLNKQGHKLYAESIPIQKRIDIVNKLYDDGHIIKIETARGTSTGIQWFDITKKQLDNWGVKYHLLRTGIKLYADFYIDDKGINPEDFFDDKNISTLSFN